MFYKFENRLVLSGELIVTSAIRLGAGRATEVVGPDLPVIKDTAGFPFIPGSSLKGVMRSHLEKLVRTVAGEPAACNPVSEDEWCITAERMQGEREAGRSEEGLSRWVVDNSCFICQVFGSPWLASHVQIRDLPVDKTLWFGQYQTRDGVAIDRDTETASEGKLYSYEVVPADTPFLMHIVVENVVPWQLGMLLVGLHELEQGHVQLGGATSRGLGSMTLGWRGRLLCQDELLTYLAGDTAGQEVLPGSDMVNSWRDQFVKKLKGDEKEVIDDAQAVCQPGRN